MSLQLLDYEAAQATNEADWSILADPQVESVAQAVARAFGRDYGLTLEYEDAYQETVIIAAERAAYVRQLLDEAGAGLLHRWLSQRLRDRWLTEAKHRAGHTSYEAARHSAERTCL
ncbi:MULTISPECIES: hypothetical protein [unclassified Streptomyces]|uniref:hypothetical protein n=1 Tax=unclassified Streptomyces TaxID=2593676 RepID=UPI000360664D|nr:MULTISPECIES: hypothetical protein [unclassified Streptomyces]MYT31774.1 hypothetical protein [Streptomyces sp. SID8354]